ncbi:DUF262 domain-containing protein [Salinibacter ruber]|uniref:DUF262 domain-containing protein n=1 Tax=Salinibacter ruber TaxID=146919 RepID=UPI0020745A6C|nr:DUF262 domain-containing protein [Salinibacter ruber]
MPEINPYYTSIGKAIGDRLFEVPKYQRNYAWERDQLDDFFSDIEKCISKRRQNDKKSHFFGGIVTVKKSITGTSDEKYQLVDGQQRIATFCIMMSQLVAVFNDLLEEAKDEEDQDSISKLRGSIENLKDKYVETGVMISMESKTFNRLSLSGPDNDFYQARIRGRDPDPGERASKRRLDDAFSYLEKRILELVDDIDSLEEKLDVLSNIISVVDVDCSIINIVTEDRQYAYELFQVLNDRGIQLTVGDLLRAKTLQILEGYSLQQNAAQRKWDDILKDKASDTKNFLSWIHSAFEGERARKSSLYDDCLSAFYPQHEKERISGSDADDILNVTEEIQEEVEYCRQFINGRWPFESHDASQLQRNRLRLLTVELGNTSCIPLLIGARHIDESTFNDVVDVTTRFFFRYRTIGSKHATPIINLFAEEGHRARENPDSFDVNAYTEHLSELISEKGPDDAAFSASLREELQYKPRGNNQNIKFFLMMVEHYYKWYQDGADGEPKILDNSVVFDFPNTDIEHIYPQSAPSEQEALEGVKHEIGNLTLLGPQDNKEASNASFQEKRDTFNDSAFRINNQLSDDEYWTKDKVKNREEDLIDIALAIFNF